MKKSEFETIFKQIEAMVTGLFILEEGAIGIMDELTRVLQEQEAETESSFPDLDKIY